MRLANCNAAKLGITQRAYGATSARLGAFGDAWTDWCGGNWNRYYNDQGQCEKGANGRGYEVAFTAPWTQAGVIARGGQWEKKAQEIVTQQVVPAIQTAVMQTTPTGTMVAPPLMIEQPGSGGLFGAPDTAMKVGLAVLALGGAFLLLKKKRGGGSLAGYRRRNPKSHRSRKSRR